MNLNEINQKQSLNQDFIMVWDNVVPDEFFCDWLVDYLEDKSSYIMGNRRLNFLSEEKKVK